MLAAGARAKPSAPPLTLASAVQYLPGAGPQFAAAAKALDILSVGDLLFHLPLRYEDRRQAVPLAELREGDEALARGRVELADLRLAGRRSLRVLLDDGQGSLLLRFFHFNDAQRKGFLTGRWVQAFGTVRSGANGLEMIHPEYRVADDAGGFENVTGLTPIYPLTAGVTQPRLRKLVAAALELAAADAHFNAQLPGLPEPQTLVALRALHAPDGDADLALLQAFRHPAQLRLTREELLAHQLCMRVSRQQVRGRPAQRLPAVDAARQALQAALPFPFTGAQNRVIAEIGADLERRAPMLRLVQGDVGSGKTVVAACAMLACARAGSQAALMAPTELLAEQHARTLTAWLEPLGVDVVFLAGRLRKTEKARVLERIADGRAPVVVGTHAMFQQAVRFAKLALVVVDEQHRFGVQQRLSLRDKGPEGLAPHQLVMSATPIPRTLAQTLYADLDVSVIDELPPGRTPIVTVALSNEKRGEVLRRVGDQCRAGRQAYWVCTLIEESDELEAEAAEATAERLRAELPDLAVGLIHGRMKGPEKDALMQAFKAGEVPLLVATTVIEVGVDVPNASIMVIENAERLGLAQLHQLRGRVGRGSAASQCLLMYQPPLSDTAKARLETLRATSDGFRIAERDLELRGPGEILGRRQTGLIGLKLADPVRDAALIPDLQTLADQWLERYPQDAKRLIARWVGDVDRYGQV